MRDLTMKEKATVSGAGEATAKGYLEACVAGGVTGAMAAAWIGAGTGGGAAAAASWA